MVRHNVVLELKAIESKWFWECRREYRADTSGCALLSRKADLLSDEYDDKIHDSTDRRRLAQILDADVIVIGVPMYNYGIPAQLKTWIDYLAVPGKTFRYTERGSEGLAGGRKVYLASSRGGLYEPGTAAAAREHQDSYLVSVLGFFGIEDVEIIRAQGVKISPAHADRTVAAALDQISVIAPPSRPRFETPELADAL